MVVARTLAAEQTLDSHWEAAITGWGEGYQYTCCLFVFPICLVTENTSFLHHFHLHGPIMHVYSMCSQLIVSLNVKLNLFIEQQCYHDWVFVTE